MTTTIIGRGEPQSGRYWRDGSKEERSQQKCAPFRDLGALRGPRTIVTRVVHLAATAAAAHWDESSCKQFAADLLAPARARARRKSQC